MATIHNTKFIKAESRVPDPMIDCRSYITSAGDGCIIRDIYISASGASILTAPKNLLNIFLPLVGPLTFTYHNSDETTIRPGEIYCYGDHLSRSITVRNLLPSDTINFLHITLPFSGDVYTTQSIGSLDIYIKNRLICGAGHADHISIGVYDGRAEDKAQLSLSDSAMIVYIINGYFEVENRLMEHRDTLLIWDTNAIAFEALSEAAIILLIEFTISK